jgi:hypothetical protein
MVFEETSGRMLLLEGGPYIVDGETKYRRNTWQWDGEGWVQQDDMGPQLERPAMAFDSGRQRVVALGIHYPNPKSSPIGVPQTWEWNSSEWTQVADTGPKRSSRLAYHALGQRIVAVEPGSETMNTWDFDGAAWTQIADVGPSPRDLFDIAYDRQHDSLVLFGGLATVSLGDTWAWDGHVWEQVTDFGPSPRAYPAMAYDSDRAVTALFGGEVKNTYFHDTWEWNGHRWAQREDMGPSPRGASAMAYDPARRKLLLFGGTSVDAPLGDTWEFGDYP